jgi:polyhydroxyalkanoate synthesis regulator protein
MHATEQRELLMKKFLITTATLVMMSTASLADSSLETMNKLFEMRMQSMKMTSQMIDMQMEMLKQHMVMLSNFQKVLQQQMENESSSHKG